MIEDVSINIHHWETNDNKSKCFDYYEPSTVLHIKDNLVVDAGSIPLIHDKNIRNLSVCAISVYAQLQ